MRCFFESAKVVVFINAPPVSLEQVVVEIFVLFPSVSFSDHLSLGKLREKICD